MQTALPSLVRHEQLRGNGTVSTFFKKVKEGIDRYTAQCIQNQATQQGAVCGHMTHAAVPACSNPELKKSLDQVRERYTAETPGCGVFAIVVLAVLAKTSAL